MNVELLGQSHETMKDTSLHLPMTLIDLDIYMYLMKHKHESFMYLRYSKMK